MIPEKFYAGLEKKNITLTTEQKQQFGKYYRLLVEWNQKVNLTAITEENDVYLKHFYDSLIPAFYLRKLREESLELCDVGAGAGFPSLPLKIVFPAMRVTIVDSLNKRIKFLETLVAALGLKDVRLVHSRAEDFGMRKSSARESFDLVTARAVANLPVLSEFCLPLTKVGGQFIALKAQKAEQELKNATYAIQTLGGKLGADIQTELPEDGESRHIIIIDKEKHTPKKYPRKAGTPAKDPLLKQKFN